MPTIKGLKYSGILFFLFFFCLVAAIIGFIQGIKWNNFYYSYAFLVLSLFFFLWGWESAR